MVCGLKLRTNRGGLMSIENEIETLEKRTLEAKKNWLEFLSDLPLREANSTLRNQTLNTNIETTPETNVD